MGGCCSGRDFLEDIGDGDALPRAQGIQMLDERHVDVAGPGG